MRQFYNPAIFTSHNYNKCAPTYPSGKVPVNTSSHQQN